MWVAAWSGMSDQELVDVLQQHFDFKPGTLVQQLQLRKPQFFRYATFGHCGRTEPVPLWERSKNLTGAAVQTALHYSQLCSQQCNQLCMPEPKAQK